MVDSALFLMEFAMADCAETLAGVAPEVGAVCTLDTSSAAFNAVGFKRLARQQQDIFDVVLRCQKAGALDMSLTEIRDAYERFHGKRIDLNRVSARVSNLVAGERLCRHVGTRLCSVSGRNVHPVFVPAEQAALFSSASGEVF